MYNFVQTCEKAGTSKQIILHASDEADWLNTVFLHDLAFVTVRHCKLKWEEKST